MTSGFGSAASLLPGEAICGVECETLQLPSELSDPDIAQDRPLWPLRFDVDSDRTFLGDYTPDGMTPPDDVAPLGFEDAPTDGGDDDPVPPR